MIDEQKSSYTEEEVLAAGEGALFAADSPKMPRGDMLMFHTVSHVSSEGGAYGKGKITAEFNLNSGLFFWKDHFKDDPIMPGVLMTDGLFQVLGFYMSWLGAVGNGRALGCKEMEFKSEVTLETKKLVYEIDIKEVKETKGLKICTGDGTVYADGKRAVSVKDLVVLPKPKIKL